MHTLLLDAVVASWERDGSPVERLRTLVLGMLERIDDNPAFFRLTLATQGVPEPAVLDGRRRARTSSGSTSPGSSATSSSRARARGTSGCSTPTRPRPSWASSSTAPCRSAPVTRARPALDEAADELCTFLLYGLAGPARAERSPALGSGGAQPGLARPPRPGLDRRGSTARGGARTMVGMRRRHGAPRPPRARVPAGRGRQGPHGHRRPLLLRHHGGGVPVAPPPRRRSGARRRGTTSAGHPGQPGHGRGEPRGAARRAPSC